MRRMARSAAITLCCAVLVGLGLAGCYDVPKPTCGFQCGPSLACPDDYTCSAGRCILNGSPLDVSCPGTDAGFVGDMPQIPDGNEPPRLVAQMPGHNDDEVPVNTTISFKFNEPVIGIDANSFQLMESDVDQQSQSFLEGAFTFPDDRSAVFTPSRPLREGGFYTVTLNGLIMDLEGATFPFAQWNFTTVPDLSPPAITAQTPAPDATGVAIEAPITVQFSEVMRNVHTGTVRVQEDVSGNVVFGNVFFDDATHTATFRDFGFLQPNTRYRVQLATGLTDFGGNQLPNTPVTWTFTTGADTIPPTVDSQTPSPGATGVTLGTAVNIQFSEEVLGATGTNLKLTAGVNPVPATVTYFEGSAFAQIAPTSPLASNTTYKVTIASGLTDLAGNPLVGAPIEWTFTTAADVFAPSILAGGRIPAPNAVNVALSSVVTIRFSEAVTNVSSATITLTPGGGSVTYSPATFTATLIPTSTLTPNTTYFVAVSAGIKDLAGNGLSNFGSWSFSTLADATPPTAMLTTPSNGATGVATTTPIVVTFDEAVSNVTGATFRVSAGGGVDGTLTSAMGNREWTYTPNMPLPSNTTVTVSLTSGIVDGFNNPLAPVSFSFVTAP